MKAMMLSLLLTLAAPGTFGEYETDTTQPVVITIAPQNSQEVVHLGCYPLIPKHEAK